MTDSVELYDPETGTWTATDELNAARDFHTATLLPNGEVLVVGGANPWHEPLKSAELYDGFLDTLVLTLDSTHYCIGDSWSLKLSNGLPNTPLRLSGVSNGQAWEIPDWRTTNSSGGFTVEGTFADGTEGRHTLSVEIGGMFSNSISFVVSNCKSKQ
jgi:hypothetical protein